MIAKSANVLVSDIRNFLKDKFLNFSFGHLLHDAVGARIEQHTVTCTQLVRTKCLSYKDYPFFISVPDDECTICSKAFFKGDDFTDRFVLAESNHIHGLVHNHFATWSQFVHRDAGAHLDPKFAALGHHDNGRFLHLQNRGEAVRRLSKTVNLRLERDDLFTRISERLDKPGIVILHSGQLSVDLR